MANDELMSEILLLFIRHSIGGAMKECHLLLVDDDPFVLEGIGEELENNGRVYPKEGGVLIEP